MILVIGGAASGKSAYAQQLIRDRGGERPTYLATMEKESTSAKARIRRHVANREGMGFITLEQPRNLDEVIDGCTDTVLVEDIGNLMANEMFKADGRVIKAADKVFGDLMKLAGSRSFTVLVTNDVFSAGMPMDAMTKEYMRQLGDLNRRLACKADEVWEVLCAIPVRRK